MEFYSRSQLADALIAASLALTIGYVHDRARMLCWRALRVLARRFASCVLRWPGISNGRGCGSMHQILMVAQVRFVQEKQSRCESDRVISLLALCIMRGADSENSSEEKPKQPLLFSGGGDMPLIVREKPPRIIYTSRTHSQLTQVMKELRKTPYKPRTSAYRKATRI